MTWLNRMREIGEKATEGPWKWSSNSQLKRVCDETSQDEYYATNAVISTFASVPLSCNMQNRDFIAFARNAWPEIVAVIEAAEYATEHGYWLDEKTVVPVLEKEARKDLADALAGLRKKVEEGK